MSPQEAAHLCARCGLPIVRTTNRGPWPKRCADCKAGNGPAPQVPAPEVSPDTSQTLRRRDTEPLKGARHHEVHLHPTGASVLGPDDAQHDACRKAAYERAIEAGLKVKGGWTTIRLVRIDSTGDRVAYVYRAEVRS